MYYATYQSLYDLFKINNPDLFKDSNWRDPVEFYESTICSPGESIFDYLIRNTGFSSPVRLAQFTNVVINQIVSEYEWYQVGLPKFKVESNFIKSCQRLPLDRIEGHQVRIPFDLPALTVSLPTENDLFRLDENKYLRSFMIFHPKQKRMERLVFANKPKSLTDFSDRTVFLFLDFEIKREAPPQPSSKGNIENAIEKTVNDTSLGWFMALDFNPEHLSKTRDKLKRGEKTSLGGEPCYGMLQTRFKSNDTMLDVLDDRYHRVGGSNKFNDGVDIPNWIYKLCWQIFLGICDLVDRGDPTVIPDVLSKDRQKMNEAIKRQDYGRIYEIQEKSKRRGNFGWIVGKTQH